MTITISTNQVEQIVDSNLEVHKALSERYALLKEVFTTGKVVYWMNRGFPQTGIAIRVVGDKHFPRIHCENSRTQNRVDVDIHLIDWDRMTRQSDYAEKVMKENGVEQ